MMKRTIQLFFVIIGGTLGFVYIPKLIVLLNFGSGLDWLTSPYTGVVVGAIIFFFLTFWFVDSLVQVIKVFEEKIVKAPVTDVLFGTLGLVFGLIVAFLIQIPLNNIKLAAISTVIPIFIYLFLGYFGFQIGFKKRDELINLFLISRTRDKKKDSDESQGKRGSALKILDTSVIIDGRIADICQTGFLEGTMVIPRFVLEELQ
ncbi:MAG TPA: PIN domain nuclease, partial [Sporolactobacillaceae bacterium]|nr:PIN domain nuclease [Sporolactobacillaceae bacterium]